jgi:monoamine oxidase
VLGGGLSGLAAAATLARAGVDAQLLEARERVGGRVMTLRAPFDDGLFAESGAEFISPGHQVLRRFLRSYGQRVRARPAAARLYHFGGCVRQGWSLADYGGPVKRDFELVEQRSLALGASIPDPARPWASPAAAALDGKSLADWLDLPRLHPIVRSYLSVWTTLDYATEAERLSLLMYARDQRLIEESPVRAGDVAPDGLDRLATAMADDLGSRVHLATPVTALHQDGGSVAVHYSRDGLPGLIEAGYAVVALPLTIVRTLEISPPFDPARRQAIDGLRYGQVLKTHLQFRRRFWNDAGPTAGAMTDLPFRSAWDSTQAQPGPRGILTTYTGSQAAVALAALPEEQRIGRCLEQLERIYPGCRADFELGVSVDWDADPAVRGAYSYFGPGELIRYGPWLARPEGRLHFAGEHTDRWQATMNGALASGTRAAGEILARRQR